MPVNTLKWKWLIETRKITAGDRELLINQICRQKLGKFSKKMSHHILVIPFLCVVALKRAIFHMVSHEFITLSSSSSKLCMEFHPCQKSKLITTFDLTVQQLTWQTSTSHLTLQLCTLYHNHWNFGHQLSKWQFNIQLYPSAFMLTFQQWSWLVDCQRKMKFESPSRMLSYGRSTNPAKNQLENLTFELINQHEMLLGNIRV